MITELHSELASDNKAVKREAVRLCELMASTAAERLGLHLYGLVAATSAQVNAGAISVL